MVSMPVQDNGAAIDWSWTVLLSHFMHRPFAGESTLICEPNYHLKRGSLAGALFLRSQGVSPLSQVSARKKSAVDQASGKACDKVCLPPQTKSLGPLRVILPGSWKPKV